MKHLNSFKRPILYIIFAVLCVFLANTWYKDYPPPKEQTAAQEAKVKPGVAVDNLDTMRTVTDKKAVHSSSKALVKHKEAVDKLGKTAHSTYVSVKTDTLTAFIDLHGGNITQVALPNYLESVKKDSAPVMILSDKKYDLYVAQSYLANSGAPESHAITYSSAHSSYDLGKQDQLNIVLTGRSPSGLVIHKTYTFTRNSYQVALKYDVVNKTASAADLSLYTQLVRKKPVNKEGGSFYRRSYMAASLSSPHRPYHKVTYKDMNKANIDESHAGGWIAMQQHYFLSAWVPESQKSENHFYSYVLDKLNPRPVYVVGFKSSDVSIAPGASHDFAATLYVGPEDTKHLALLAPGLDHTIDFGFLWFVSNILFTVMAFCHRFLGNWGWAIVITTILIKVVFYWFSAKSFISMARMRELQPKLKALQEQHADDKQALSQATMGLYKKEGVSPLGGCLPMIIQIPVFIALYYVIFESVQLRHAPFMFWIHDLSSPDPYYVLPILMVLSMVLQQFLSPTATDPTQAKMMLIIPLVMGFLFRNFPAGLVLYWCVNNLVQALQQWYVTKRYHAGKYKQKLKKAKKKRA